MPWDLYLSQNPWIKEQLNSINPWYAGGDTRTFVQVAENSVLEKVSLKIKDITISKVQDFGKQYNPEVFLQPMSKWYLYADFKNGINANRRCLVIWCYRTLKNSDRQYFLLSKWLPFFNRIVDSQVTILWSKPLFWFFGVLFSFFTGIIAGIYPALYLSSFKPVRVLKGAFKPGQNTSMPRQDWLLV